MRPLTFRDDRGNEHRRLPDDDLSATDAFEEFVGRYRKDDTASLSIEDDERGETLVLRYDLGAVSRTRTSPEPEVAYRLVAADHDYRNLAFTFIRGGFAQLGLRGSWVPDLDSLTRARIRSEFEASPLRRTHPRELFRRLAILTRCDGREPSTVDGVTHYGYRDGGGDSVNAWFDAAGRGLLVAFAHNSAVNDTGPRPDLYDGVPRDLLTMVRDAARPDRALNVSDPDGRAPLAATGVAHFSGPCVLSEGLVTRLQRADLGVGDTGFGRLLDDFLTLPDFTPEAVAGAAAWWSAEDITTAFAATDEPETSTVPTDPAAVERFCRIWADSGYNDRWDVHYVLFDGEDIEDVEEDRAELLELITTLGLDRVDTPPGGGTGEVWVRTDPRVDAELGNWA